MGGTFILKHKQSYRELILLRNNLANSSEEAGRTLYFYQSSAAAVNILISLYFSIEESVIYW